MLEELSLPLSNRYVEFMIPFQTESLAKVASLYAGCVFGLYWIPLRALVEAGFPGLWATVVLNAVPLAFVLPVIFMRFSTLASAGALFHLGSLTLGISYTFYMTAFVFTTVVNVVVLYYLLPVWGFLLARIFTGDRITGVRVMSMILGFSGIFVIFGVNQGFPLPQNPGDWMALGAGFLWAGGSLMVLMEQKNTAVDFGLGFIFWGTIGATIMAVAVTALGWGSEADFAELSDIAVWLIPVGLLMVLPASFATIFGPKHLNPGVVGLLFMTEISVGATSAAILTDEPFGPRQITGVIVISIAGILETAWDFFTRSKPKSAP